MIDTTSRASVAQPGRLLFMTDAGVVAMDSDQVLELRPAVQQRFAATITSSPPGGLVPDPSGSARSLVARFDPVLLQDHSEHSAPVLLDLPVERHVVLETEDLLPEAVSRIGLVRRRPQWTHDEFAQHYLTTHVPLVMEHGPLFRAYSVNLVDGPEQAWDAVVWQTFDSIATWAEHDRQVMEDKPAVREDMARFVGELVSFEGRSPRGGTHQGVPTDSPSTTGVVGP